jgi:hypothetical protein
MARRFFYICAGMFLLALSYHLGAEVVVAQTSAVEGAGVDAGSSGPIASGSVSRYFCNLYADNSDALGSLDVLPLPITGTSPVVATSAANGFVAVLEDGSVYKWNGYWIIKGSLIGAPVPTLHESWGQVKARYLATPGMTVTPGANDR